jgi:hypothetical protein
MENLSNINKEDERNINEEFNEYHEKYYKLLDEALLIYDNDEIYSTNKIIRKQQYINEKKLCDLEDKLAYLAIEINYPDYKIIEQSCYKKSYTFDNIFFCVIPIKDDMKIKCYMFLNKEEAQCFSIEQRKLYKNNPFLRAIILNC